MATPGGTRGDRGGAGAPTEPRPGPAAILGMYTLMSNKQYYDAICSGTISNTEGINSECPGDTGSGDTGTSPPQTGDTGSTGLFGEGFGDQNPSGIPHGDPTHACKRACPRVSVPPCAVTCVPAHACVPQAW